MIEKIEITKGKLIMVRKYEARFELRKYRIYRKLSQTELANKVDLTPSTIGKYESGEMMPLFSKWIDLANVLDIPPKDFWEITELILDKEKVKN
jgi:DNA-binding XRE family transcriptional regulator